MSFRGGRAPRADRAGRAAVKERCLYVKSVSDAHFARAFTAKSEGNIYQNLQGTNRHYTSVFYAKYIDLTGDFV